MKKLAIIPARYASSRFPGKPLIDLAGKSMVQRVYEGVQNTHLFDEVVVATDHEKIVEHVRSFNGNVMLTASSHNSGTERCGEVIKKFPTVDVVVNIQGDEPLVNEIQLQQLLAAFDDSSVRIATLGTPSITDKTWNDTNRIKIVTNHKNDALYFSRSPIPFERNKESYPFLKHIGLYGFKRSILEELVLLSPTTLEKTESLEQLRWLYYGYSIRVMETEIETPNIDTPEDVQLVLDTFKK